MTINAADVEVLRSLVNESGATWCRINQVRCRDVLDHRADLVDGVVRLVGAGLFSEMHRGTTSNAGAVLQRHLSASPIYFCAEPFMDLWEASSRSYPSDVERTPMTTDGIAFFARPVHVDGIEEPMNAVFWCSEERRWSSWSTCHFGSAPSGLDLGLTLHGEHWVFGAHGGQVLEADRHMHVLLNCMWALMETPRLVTDEPALIERAARRRAERAKLPSEVRYIDLRHPEHAPTRSTSADVDWSHRWIVSGHWTNQPYGPAQSLRRPQWIAPYVKGPDDKPLVVKENVGVLR